MKIKGEREKSASVNILHEVYIPLKECVYTDSKKGLNSKFDGKLNKAVNKILKEYLDANGHVFVEDDNKQKEQENINSEENPE